MTFQDVLSIGGLIATVCWMSIAYALFKLQAETFKSQLDMQKLDYQRYLDELLPEFKFTFEHNLDLVSGTVIVEVLSNPVLDFYVKGDSYNRLLTHGELQTPRDVNAGATAEFRYSLVQGESKETFWNSFGGMYGYRLRFTLFYTDKKRLNKYQQTLDYFYKTKSTILLVPVVRTNKQS